MAVADFNTPIPRSRMRSPYMEWAKTQSQAKYTLASSGVASYPLADFIRNGWVQLDGLEITGPAGYGYAPLQQALAAKAGVSPEHVVAASGTSLANHLAMAASFDPGDDVLVEQPTYELLLSAARYLGANIRRFARHAQDGYRLDSREVERAITPKTRLIVVSNLHNPSSALATDDELREVGSVADSVGARVLVDEVYLEACYGVPWRSAIHLGKQFTVTSSLTKAYGLSGLRCGWILAEPELARAMWRIHDLYGVNAPHPAERLSVIALAHLKEIASRYQALLATNRPVVNAFLDSRPDLELKRQPYGTVLFPKLARGKAGDFCRLLRERYETSVVPGSFFEDPDSFRMYLAADPAIESEGLKRIGAALDEVQ